MRYAVTILGTWTFFYLFWGFVSWDFLWLRDPGSWGAFERMVLVYWLFVGVLPGAMWWHWNYIFKNK